MRRIEYGKIKGNRGGKSFFKGLNKPVDLKFFSTIFEISSPNVDVSNEDIFSDLLST